MAQPKGYTRFDTPVGQCAIAWGENGIVGVSLPSAGESPLLANIRKRFPDAVETDPPHAVQDAITRVRALLSGESDDLMSIALDMDGIADFNKRVYDVARAIPPGQTLTYGEVAEKLKAPPGAARAVGQALGANPFPIIVPCHRVLGAGGKTGGFSAPGGTTTKMRMLNIEGAKTANMPSLFSDLPMAAAPRRSTTPPKRRR